MVVFDAVDLVLRVHGEGDSIQTLVADDAAEAAWVVGFAQGLQDLRMKTLENENHRQPHTTHNTQQTTHNRQHTTDSVTVFSVSVFSVSVFSAQGLQDGGG